MRGLSQRLQELRSTWELLDSDANGHVDIDEVKNVFQSVGQESHSR